MERGSLTRTSPSALPEAALHAACRTPVRPTLHGFCFLLDKNADMPLGPLAAWLLVWIPTKEKAHPGPDSQDPSISQVSIQCCR